MKKYSVLMICIFTALQSSSSLAENTAPMLEDSLKQPVNEPGIMSIVFSLGVVIFLIYITGLIYSKLNVVGAKTVQKQLKTYDLLRAVVLSTTQLGQGKNLHVIEIAGKRYLIGAAPNSINLIKELEEDKSHAEIENPENIRIDETLDDTGVSEKVDEFDIHKKYL